MEIPWTVPWDLYSFHPEPGISDLFRVDDQEPRERGSRMQGEIVR